MRLYQRMLLAAVVLCSWLVVLQSATAQGTAFTYQGRLVGAGGPANGPHDFQFSLWTASGGAARSA